MEIMQRHTKEWRPLAEQGNADAQYNLGHLYSQGLGVPKISSKLLIGGDLLLSRVMQMLNLIWGVNI